VNWQTSFQQRALDKVMVRKRHSPRFWYFTKTILGMTETATSISLMPWHMKQGVCGSAGRLLPGVTARVVKEDGSLAKVGERGELVVKSPSIALRYTNDAKA
jgi:acyl-coenzyme A synthetase/AMP-(fatty) acid ligase